MKNTRFLCLLLITVFLLFSSVLVANADSFLIRGSTMEDGEIRALQDVGTLKGRVYTAHFEATSGGRIVVTRVRLNGQVEATRTLKGGATNRVIEKIQIASAGERLYVSWLEKDNLLIPNYYLYLASSFDGVNFITSNIETTTNVITWADIAADGSTVFAVYGLKSGTHGEVMSKRSTDAGANFSSPSSVYRHNYPGNEPVQISVSKGNNVVGASFSFYEYAGDIAGNPVFQMNVYYSQATMTANTWSSVTTLTAAVDAPNRTSIARHISVAFSKSGNPWVAWGSSAGNKICYRVRSASGWSELRSFSSDNTGVTSVILHSVGATYDEGVLVTYSKGASSNIFYRAAKANGEGEFETSENLLASGAGNYLSATDLNGRPCAVYVGSDSFLKVEFRPLAQAGRTGKLRYALLDEGFESSNVKNSSLWRTWNDAGSANCYFSETSNWKATGSKSLWAAGWLNGTTNTTGMYPTSTTSNLETLVDISGFESQEVTMNYSFSRKSDPQDVATFGLGSLYSLTETTSTGATFLSYASSHKRTDFSAFPTLVVPLKARFISDADGTRDIGLLIDDLKVFGYTLPRPGITGIESISNGLRVHFNNPETDPETGSRAHIFRATSERGPFVNVGSTLNNYYDDVLSSSGTYYYQVVIENGIDESAPSAIGSGTWTPTYPIINTTPSSLSFSAVEGASNPPPQTLSITNTGGGTLSWSATDTATWLTLSPTTGTAPSSVTVSVSTAGLSAGSYGARITITAPGASTVTVSVSLTISPPPPPPPPPPPAVTISRISGESRYDTAVELSKSSFESARYVIIATGENFPDALSGAPLAYALSAPILLVTKDSLPPAVADEIKRLGASNAIILGGTNAVSINVEDAIRTLGLTPERIAGSDRYHTSALIASRLADALGRIPAGAFIATGENFPDALAASGVAARLGLPILLVQKNAIPSSVQSSINLCSYTIVVGGEAVVSSSVFARLPSPRRLSGDDRYRTARAIADYAVVNGFSTSGLIIATGANFPDALAAGVVSARSNNPELLVSPVLPLSAAVEDYLSLYKSQIRTILIVGGPNAVSEEVRSRIESLLK